MSPLRQHGARLSVPLLLLLLACPSGADNIADLLGRLVLEGTICTNPSATAGQKPGSSAFSPSFSPLLLASRQPSFCPITPALPGLPAFSLDAKGPTRQARFQSPVIMRSFARGGPTGHHKPGQTLPYMGSSPKGATHKVLVLNASYEPLSVVSAPRALALLGDGKAMMVVENGQWRSCGGSTVDVPSVVSLRRYISVRPKIPPLNRKSLMMRDKGECQYCGTKADNIDHVVPRARGGPTTWENCVAACMRCNCRKAANLLKDMPNMKLRSVPAVPKNLSWVHSAVLKVDPLWTPYIGEAVIVEKGNRKTPAKVKSKSKKAAVAAKKRAHAMKAAAAPPPPPSLAPEEAAEAARNAYAL